MSQQHFGSEPLKALKLKLTAVETHSFNSVCVFLCVSSLLVSMDFTPNRYGSTQAAAGLSKDF